MEDYLLHSDLTSKNPEDLPESVIPICTELTSSNFQPQLYFTWDVSSSYPNSNQVIAPPVVGDINGDEFPEIAFVSYEPPYDINTGGVLRVLEGSTLVELFNIGSEEALAPKPNLSPLLIDIDRDGKGEIIYVHITEDDEASDEAVALNSDGSLRWQISITPFTCGGGLSAADLNGDGVSEIIANGEILSESQDGLVSRSNYSDNSVTCNRTQIATKLSPSDSEMSIIDGSGVYQLEESGDYTLRFASNCNYCFAAVADINSAYSGKEVIYTGNKVFKIYSSSGQLISEGDLVTEEANKCADHSTTIVGGGAATIGNFDSQPETIEFAVVTGKTLTVFDKNGSKIATSEIQDCSSKATGVTSFDLNGDGQSELLYADETMFRVYHMKNQSLEVLWESSNSSGTYVEYPVVADLNGDFSPEILVVANNHLSNINNGLRIFSASQTVIPDNEEGETRWMPARNVWNQHNYFIYNVDKFLGATNADFLSFDLDKSFRKNSFGQDLLCRPPSENPENYYYNNFRKKRLFLRNCSQKF